MTVSGRSWRTRPNRLVIRPTFALCGDSLRPAGESNGMTVDASLFLCRPAGHARRGPAVCRQALGGRGDA
jgi:hypothetical protein